MKEKLEKLVSFIKAHQVDAWITPDGKLIAIAELYHSELGLTYYRPEEIAPTFSAVRDWLGY